MLILVRHGRTQANAAGLLLGRLDPPLDEVGREQAAAVARIVDSPSRVVCSPLARTRQTAAAFGVPVTIDDRWIELDYGEWDGRPVSAIPADTWTSWRSDIDFAPPGGESLADLGKRVRAACADLVDEARDTDVVVVSHVSPIKAAVAWTVGVSDSLAWRLFLSPASISRVAIGPASASLHSFNETHHLKSRNLPQP